jgi:site-specific recombinase XerD
LRTDFISKSFSKARQKANIDNFRFHDLRHDFCSRLVQRGVDLYAVAALAGHKDIKMTQRYAHLSPERLRSAVETLNPDYNLTTMTKKRASQH